MHATHDTNADQPHAVVDEAHEFLTTLLATPPSQLTACAGWTAHELVAHLAAGAAEEADLIEAHVDGQPNRPTRGFDEREAPYRALPDDELRGKLFEHSIRLAGAIGRLGPGAVDFTGRAMTAAEFSMHSSSECVLHRWDLIGRDDVGWEMLRRPALTRHAVTVLTSMHTLDESFSSRLERTDFPDDVRVVVRSLPADDLVVEWRDGKCTVTLASPVDEPVALECDPAQRLLVLWGRREPSSPMHLHATGPARRLVELLLR